MEELELTGYEAVHRDERGRCPQCGYVRHPCDVRELVAEVRRLRAALDSVRLLVECVTLAP